MSSLTQTLASPAPSVAIGVLLTLAGALVSVAVAAIVWGR